MHCVNYSILGGLMVILAGCCHRTCNCINCNTHDGNEYAKCLVSNVRDFSFSTQFLNPLEIGRPLPQMNFHEFRR
jgi:hypothetical protein